MNVKPVALSELHLIAEMRELKILCKELLEAEPTLDNDARQHDWNDRVVRAVLKYCGTDD